MVMLQCLWCPCMIHALKTDSSIILEVKYRRVTGNTVSHRLRCHSRHRYAVLPVPFILQVQMHSLQTAL